MRDGHRVWVQVSEDKLGNFLSSFFREEVRCLFTLLEGGKDGRAGNRGLRSGWVFDAGSCCSSLLIHENPFLYDNRVGGNQTEFSNKPATANPISNQIK